MIAKKKVLLAIKGSYGNVSVISERLNCSRQAVYDWLKRDEKVKELYEAENERILDLAEAKMINKINEGSEAMIALVLKTKGRKRGYGEHITLNEDKERKPDLSCLTKEELKAIAAIKRK